ncbi:MAG: hypothetical protein IPP48_16790 [Chitinophagaceae bacterium]|nr:hypothetical protein [Chitinophagaceae bacterium]
MTLKEFRKAVAESPDVDFYQNLKLDLNYQHINFLSSFSGVVSIYEFVLTQIEGFESLEDLPSQLVEVKKNFIKLKNAIIELFNNKNKYVPTWNDNFEILRRKNPLMFVYDSPETAFFNKYK